MFRHKFLIITIFCIIINNITNASEIYNKNGNKLDLYGKVVSMRRFYFSNKNTEDNDQTYAHLGFKGETQINNQLIGYSHWEYNITGNNSEGNYNLQKSDNKTYLGYVGLKINNSISLDYGRNYGIIHEALNYTNIAPEFSGANAYNDNFFVGRVSSIVTYRNTNFFGLIKGFNLGIQYLSKNERIKNYIVNENKYDDNFIDLISSNGRGWGASLSYKLNDFSIIGAYSIAGRTNAQKDPRLKLGKGEKIEQWATGLKYDINNIYLAANYSETHNSVPIIIEERNHSPFTITKGFANKTQDILLAAKYKFDFGLCPSISYIQSKAKDIEDIIIDNANLIKYIEVGASYHFNNNMSTYIDYKINQMHSNKLSLNYDDIVALGMKYEF